MSAAKIDTQGLRMLVRKAVIWRSGSQIVSQLIAWASTFLVLRILDPADYGLYAMAAVVLTLLGLLNGYGLANALIQREEVNRKELRQLFGMLLVLNILLAIAQVSAAPLIAQFYEQPEVADLLRVLALVFLTNPFLALGYTILSREMDFKRQAQVNLATAMLGAVVALAGALAGLGVWTLVLAPLSVFVTRAVAMTIVARAFMWPSFDFRGAGAIASFGGAVTLSSVLYFLQTQSDVVIAGRNFDAATVGLYTTALFLAQIFVNKVVPPLNEVAFTALARAQADREAFANGFLISVHGIMLLAIPFCLGLAVTAEPFVRVVLGEKWLGIVPLLQVLGCAMPWMVLQVLFAPTTNAAGRPGIAVRNAAIGALVMPLAFIVAVQWGIEGMAWAWLAAYPVIALITAATSLPAIGVSPTRLLAAIVPSTLAGIAMAFAVYVADMALADAEPVLRLVALVALGATIYCGWLFLFARERLLEFIALVRNR